MKLDRKSLLTLLTNEEIDIMYMCDQANSDKKRYQSMIDDRDKEIKKMQKECGHRYSKDINSNCAEADDYKICLICGKEI